ncbi:UGSC family (seleno)protein [Agromyces sp. NPDC049794]|uniref:UGSC family (seleno)protein n=1 Tax=unclassified Agromyces TaxID=2639701 RepID=UPI0033D365B6
MSNSQAIAYPATADEGGDLITVHDPTGYPPEVKGKAPAARLETLDGRTIYLVDSRFDDSIELLRQVEAWFREHMPTVTVRVVQLASTYAKDDPELWERIRADGDAAILGVGHCSTCAPAVSTHAITLETKYGIPTVAVHTEKFEKVVRSVTRMGGLPQAPLVFVPQPVMGKRPDELRAYVHGADPITGRAVMQEIVEGLTRPIAQSTADLPAGKTSEKRFVAPARKDRLHDLFLERDWTDKLPIVLPTERRVAEMLAGTSRRPDEIVGRMEPTENRGAWSYTVEKVAVNAVMAGARPEYLPVILALAASGRTARGSTSSSGAAMVVVNGPVRSEIGMNSGTGALGPYNHANATIGRAYGLSSQNLQGGSVPGESFMGSLGNNYTYNNITFAENEERSPWEPLHVQQGYNDDDSTVTLFFGARSTTFSLGLREQHWREHVRDMLLGTDAVTGPVLLLDPIAARQFVERGGFSSKADLIGWIHDTAKMPAGRYWDLQLVQNYIYPRATFGEEPMASGLSAAPEEPIPMFPLENINVVVVGGETNGYWQIMGARHTATVSVDEWR